MELSGVSSDHCCISQCRNFKNPFANIELYPLPDDVNRRAKSCEILGIPLDIGLQPSARVCALHFKSKVGHLKPESMPEQSTVLVDNGRRLFVLPRMPTAPYPKVLPPGSTAPLLIQPRPTGVILQNVMSKELNAVPSTLKSSDDDSTNTNTDVDSASDSLNKNANVDSASDSLNKNTNVDDATDSTNENTNVNSISDSANKNADVDMISDSTSKNTNVDNTPDSIDSDDDSTSSAISLELECEEDALSTAQLNAYMKDLMDFISANELIHRLPPAVPRGVDSPLISQCIDSSGNTISKEGLSFSDLNLAQNKNLPSVVNWTVNPSPSLSVSEFLPSLPLTSTNAAPVEIIVPQSSIPLVNTSNICSISTTNNTATVIAPSFLPSQLPLISANPTPTSIISTINNASSVFNKVALTQISTSSQMTTSTTNAFVSKYVQVPPTVNNTPGEASNVKVEKTNVNPAFTMGTTASLSKAATMASIAVSPILNQISCQSIDINNSLPKESIRIENVTPASPAYDILPNNFNILDAVSTNAVIPVMLHKSAGAVNNPVQFIDSSIKNVNSVSTQSILRNVLDQAGFSYNASAGKAPDVLETCPVTLNSVPVAAAKSSSSELIIGTSLSNQIPLFYDNIQGVISKQGITYDVATKKIPLNETLTVSDGMLITSSLPSMVTSNGAGPMIVKVISAKEGASEYFAADKIPNSLLQNEEHAQLDASKSDTKELSVQKKLVDKLIYANKNSLFSLQKSIPMISFASTTYADINYLFQLKIPTTINLVEEAQNLRERLRKENFIPLSIWWLLQRRYFPTTLPCSFCTSKRFIVDEDNQFPDGFCWTCSSKTCSVQTPIKRSDFFARFKSYSVRELLLLTYHWVCQSSLEDITQDVDMDIEKIWYYFKALQELCHQAMVRKAKLGVTPGSKIEASVMRVGNVYVLGALDRKTRFVRLEAIIEKEACNSVRHLHLLEKWMYKKSILITENKIKNDLLPNLVTVGANPRVTDIASDEPHILTITEFLKKNVTSMFGRTDQVSYKYNVIQGFLYELQWRIKYGSSFEAAFLNIFNHMREIYEDKGNTHMHAIQYRRGEFSVTSNISELNSHANERWASCPEGNISSFTVQVATGMFNNATKSYAKNVAYGELQKVALLKGEMPAFSIFFRDVPEISGGLANITPRALLAIKIHFGDSQKDIDIYRSNAEILGLRLNAEGFIEDPVRWLANKSFISSTSPCYVCRGPSVLTENPKFSDDYSWLCQNEECKFENVFKRPSFFARFGQYPMSYVAEMILFWITQSDVSRMRTNIPLDLSRISDAWRSFQVLCSAALKRSRDKIGGSSRPIEVAMVRYGKLYILGAMDRRTNRTFVQAFPAEMGQANTIYYTLQSWISPGSTIIINATKNFKMHLICKEYKFILFNESADKNTTNINLKNVTSYLVKHVSKMFGHVKAHMMRQEVMQGYLEELMWREKFGKDPQQAFSWIMNEIFFSERRMKSPGFREETVDPLYAPIQIKELRVALTQIPNSVLKHYNIKIPEPSNASRNLKKEASSEVLLETYPDIEQYTASPSFDDGDENMVIEPDILISDSLENSSNCQTVTEQLPCQFIDPVEPSSSVNNFKVQPLVIKMHKKRKKFKSYLKSELESARSNRTLNKETSDENFHRLKNSRIESVETATSDSCQSNLLDSTSTDDLKPNSSQSVKKRSAALNTKTMCIECGESVTLNHFMKQFSCTDCKKTSVYTTCCSKAFVAHRSSLLFGKRMSRRKPDHYGLHHPIILPNPFFCPCGFSSNQGNKLASHMVKCGVATCYQNL
ncbi:uncharacterized protein TNIN_91961 [Trichonephila inaurata madagascariensis]|uniref:POGZ/Z280C-D-like double Zinc finger domain-containing protein n=1 Tax=Trichonephila inaurata madagascariensis TaxID=2747483 RepID=A0A8X6XEC2_9ARAC|nr:uncharacterized protein TNIN_91961 [Trichonephila inaurata madagascariensis]